MAPINLETNQIHLNSGTICKYSDTNCIDMTEDILTGILYQKIIVNLIIMMYYMKATLTK